MKYASIGIQDILVAQGPSVSSELGDDSYTLFLRFSHFTCTNDNQPSQNGIYDRAVTEWRDDNAAR